MLLSIIIILILGIIYLIFSLFHKQGTSTGIFISIFIILLAAYISYKTDIKVNYSNTTTNVQNNNKYESYEN